MPKEIQFNDEVEAFENGVYYKGKATAIGASNTADVCLDYKVLVSKTNILKVNGEVWCDHKEAEPRPSNGLEEALVMAEEFGKLIEKYYPE